MRFHLPVPGCSPHAGAACPGVGQRSGDWQRQSFVKQTWRNPIELCCHGCNLVGIAAVAFYQRFTSGRESQAEPRRLGFKAGAFCAPTSSARAPAARVSAECVCLTGWPARLTAAVYRHASPYSVPVVAASCSSWLLPPTALPLHLASAAASPAPEPLASL